MPEIKPSPPGQVLQIPLAELHPAPFNRPERSGFDDKSLAELAQSIAGPAGIVQPLVVRRVPDPKTKGQSGLYQIVCGERRWTAAKLAKLATVPCLVRELDDRTAREINIIENLQREGVHEIEEARGYQELLNLRDDAGKPVYTIEAIAQKVGKSAPFIYGRLKLLKLPAFAQQAFFSGKLNASVALLLCRIPDPKLAHKAACEVLAPWSQSTDPDREKHALDPEYEAMSYRKAKDHISEKYMIRLKGAPFPQDDATLLPAEFADGPPLPGSPAHPAWVQRDLAGAVKTARVAGGACTDCPHRTGNMKALFAEVESADVCTNTACYKRKKDAAFRRQANAAKEKGQVLLTPGKAEQLIDYHGNFRSSEFIDLRAKVPGKRQTWEEALEEHLPEDAKVHVAKTGKKNLLLLPIDDAVKAAKAAGLKLEKPEPSSNGYDPAAEKRKDEARAKKKAHAAALADRLIAALAEAAAKVKPKVALLAAARGLCGHGYRAHFQLGNESAFNKHLDALDETQLRTALVVSRALYRNAIDWQGNLEEDLLDACKEFNVDVKALQAAHDKALADQEKKAAKVPDAKAKAAK